MSLGQKEDGNQLLFALLPCVVTPRSPKVSLGIFLQREILQAICPPYFPAIQHQTI